MRVHERTLISPLSSTGVAPISSVGETVMTARAGLVDRDAFIEALRDHRLAGAGLDVFHEEPIPVENPLLAMANVVLTPHNAGTTREVIARGLDRAVENVERFLRGEAGDSVTAP